MCGGDRWTVACWVTRAAVMWGERDDLAVCLGRSVVELMGEVMGCGDAVCVLLVVRPAQ